MDRQYKEDFITAGALAREVRAFGKSLIKKGASYNAVIAQINKKITEIGAEPAFPPQIALNNIAAHFLPQPYEDIIFSDQVVKLDVGISFQGAIGDCAVTIDLSGKCQPLLDAVNAALANAEKSITVGMPFGEIGKIIEDTISSHGFSPVRNLSGHGLGRYKIHTPPAVPNYHEKPTVSIKPGMTFAIEPFATNGQGFIQETGIATIFAFVKKRSVKSPTAHLILEKIQAFKGLPFCIHHFLHDKMSLSDVRKAMGELLRAGVIEGYPPLTVEPYCLVVQAENSVLVDEEGKVFITTK